MYIPLTFEGALQKCIIASSSYQGTFISGGIQYGYHAITGSGTFEVYDGSLQAQVIVVGGGGGGGTSNRASGGGGGGQVKYLPSQQLYKGVYTISIGDGGIGGTQAVPATQGGTTSITGPGFSLAAIGGYPGSGTTGGTSGDGFTGGTGCTNVSGNGGGGGGGGGSTAAAANVNCAQPTIATDGGAGFSFTSATGWTFGCGGGGGSSSGDGGESCIGGDGFGNPGTPGGPNSGNGGGGSWRSAGYAPGGNGGSGVVIIQYRINDYCKNFFNETGSCGCSEITFDVTDPLNYNPYLTASYAYTPCSTSNVLITGSVKAYYPTTVCAVSNSYFWGPINNGVYTQYNGQASGNNCFSASYGVQTCTTQSFIPTCTSSIWTFYAGTGSTSPQTLYWVPKNESNVLYESLANNYVNYKCVSSGSIINGGSVTYYPVGISGIGSRIFQSASCLYTTFTATWNGVGPTTAFAAVKYRECNGTITELALERGATSGTTVRSASFCSDGTTTITTRYGGGFPIPSMIVSYGTSCLGNYIDTGSCGCP
jgi:hypothetical protein